MTTEAPIGSSSLSTAGRNHAVVRSRHVAGLALYGIFAAFIAEDVRAIGVPPEQMTRLYAGGIPVRDLALLLALVIFLASLRSIRRIVGIPIILLAGLGFVLAVIEGAFSYGFSNTLNADIRGLLWFFGGLAFGYLLVKTGRAAKHLQVMLVITTVAMAMASLFSDTYYQYRLTGEMERISHPSVYAFGGFLVAPLALLLTLTRPSLRAKAIPLLCIGVYAYFGAVLSSTRSILITTCVLVAIALTSFGWRITQGAVIQRPHRRVAGFVTALAIIGGAGYLFSHLDSYRSARFASILNPGVVLADSRAAEVAAFYFTSTPLQLAIGRGIGGSIPSPIYGGDAAGTMHIGIMNVWMKFGFAPFLLALYMIVVVVPRRYVRAWRVLRREGRIVEGPRSADLLVLPATFPWIVALLISGGFSEENFLLGGMLVMFYGFVRRYGPTALSGRNAKS